MSEQALVKRGIEACVPYLLAQDDAGLASVFARLRKEMERDGMTNEHGAIDGVIWQIQVGAVRRTMEVKKVLGY